MTENKTHGRTKAGVELTDEVLDELAEQAEAGLDVTKLRRAVDERAAAEHTTAYHQSPTARPHPHSRRSAIARPLAGCIKACVAPRLV
jgi:DNA-binding transcriptional MocR family regulator